MDFDWQAGYPTTRVPVFARNIVSTSHPLAAQAGLAMIQRGGNAVDAAIAAAAMMTIVEPCSNGLGSDAFCIVWDGERLHGLNASGPAPAAWSREYFRRRHGDGGDRPPMRGWDSVTVPGAVAGWDALRARLGTLPMADLLAAAIRYADEGFPVTDVIAAHWEDLTAKLESEPGARHTYLPGGRAPRAGEIFRNPDLAGSLRLIAAHGREGFYAGRTAEAILAISDENDGTMAAADLTEFEPEWVDPISTTYRGWTVYELPPSTQGIAALMMLNLMEAFPLADYGFHSTRALHLMIEAKKLAYADMLQYVGDARFAEIPVAALLDKTLARERAALIDAGRAAQRVEPSVFDGLTNAVGGDTIYLSAIDRHGNIVSLIQSIYAGFGTALVPPGSGFALHNRGALFTLDETHPNALAPRKRPLHTIIPAFMEKGDTRIGFGIMGGFNQAQAHAQFVANIVDYRFDIQQALEAGRFTKLTFSGADVNIEELVPEAVRDELTALGHEVSAIPPRTGLFGHGQAVMSDGSGVHFGASEPRHDGAAIPETPPVFDTKPA